MSKRVVIVDDDGATLQALTHLFEQNGHRVWGFATGQSMQQGLPEDVDTALIDIDLPGARGTDLAESLKQKHPEIKVLFMSGYKIDPDVLRPGATVFAKPLSIDRLLKAI